MKRFKSVQATGSPQVIRLENKVSRDDVERVDHATRKIIFREAGATHKAWCSGDDMCGASLHRGMNYSLSPALCTPDTDTALPCPPRRPSVGDTVIYNVPHAPPSLLSLLFFFFFFLSPRNIRRSYPPKGKVEYSRDYKDRGNLQNKCYIYIVCDLIWKINRVRV